MRIGWFIATELIGFLAIGCAHGAPSEATNATGQVDRGDEIATPEPKPAYVVPDRSRDHGRFVVHEWGTFTAMQGVDGLAVDGLQHEGETLPAFVHTATSPPIPSPYRPWGDPSFDVRARHVNTKGETPIIYFYSDTPRDVRVRVDFEGGLLSEWFPHATLAPQAAEGPIDLAKIPRSSLGWDVTVTPFARGAPAPLPRVEASDPWGFGREVGAAFVTTKRDEGAAPETEHYLFYRGLARLRLPASVEALEGGGGVVANPEKEPVDGVYWLEIGETSARFLRVDEAIGAGARRTVSPSGAMRPKDDVVRDLSREVTATLVAHGLYADEARAMVRTWASTWFAAEGTRLLYVIPRPRVEEILRLSITPKPDAIERVMVARQEVLTPSTTREIEQALRDREAPALRDAAMRRLGRLGRFLEPALRAIGEQSRDLLVRQSAADVLAEIRSR